MPRRSFGRSRRSAPRRKLVWARTAGTQIFAHDTGTGSVPARVDALALFEQSLAASTIGCTVTRVRGLMRLLDVDLEAGVQLQARATMYVGDDSDITPTALDNAFSPTGMNKDFFLFEPFLQLSTSTASESYDLTGRLIDVKSSRKIEELNQTIFFDVSGATLAGAPGSAALVYDLSMLLMLP